MAADVERPAPVGHRRDPRTANHGNRVPRHGVLDETHELWIGRSREIGADDLGGEDRMQSVNGVFRQTRLLSPAPRR